MADINIKYEGDHYGDLEHNMVDDHEDDCSDCQFNDSSENADNLKASTVRSFCIDRPNCEASDKPVEDQDDVEELLDDALNFRPMGTSQSEIRGSR